MSRRSAIAIGTLLLLAYFGTRLAALTAFPSFVDEAAHVDFGRVVLATGPFARSEEGRQLVIWLYILFGAQSNAPLWAERAATLLAVLPGFAAALGIARLMSNRWGAIFAALLL
ncbi:MAG TPA: hypothetical protein VHD90_01180, partial [Phototrophicaceae bacterium]|nr:hypothetical protein [Phototrophicaceae bacterium]